MIAELLGAGSATEEFIDRWRTPGDARSKQWEERFGEMQYVAARQGGVGRRAEGGRRRRRPTSAAVVIAGHARPGRARSLTKRLGVEPAASSTTSPSPSA